MTIYKVKSKPVSYRGLKAMRRDRIASFCLNAIAAILLCAFMVYMILAWMLNDPVAIVDLIDKPLAELAAHTGKPLHGGKK